jgi:hypothetical protein
MQDLEHEIIRVQREWDDWKTVEVRAGDVHDVHWQQRGGAPRPILHGYISPASIIDGTLASSDELAQAASPLLVCILKQHTAPLVYAALIARVNAHTVQAPVYEGLYSARKASSSRD